MSEIVEFYTAAMPHSPHNESRLMEEIAFLESRLLSIGAVGDCAYEKSLARTYAALLKTRRNQLSAVKKSN